MRNIEEVKGNLEVIKELVRTTDLKYKDIAGTLDVHIETLSRWVNGKHIPTNVYHKKLKEIAEFYKK